MTGLDMRTEGSMGTGLAMGMRVAIGQGGHRVGNGHGDKSSCRDRAGHGHRVVVGEWCSPGTRMPKNLLGFSARFLGS